MNSKLSRICANHEPPALILTSIQYHQPESIAQLHWDTRQLSARVHYQPSRTSFNFPLNTRELFPFPLPSDDQPARVPATPISAMLLLLLFLSSFSTRPRNLLSLTRLLRRRCRGSREVCRSRPESTVEVQVRQRARVQRRVRMSMR